MTNRDQPEMRPTANAPVAMCRDLLAALVVMVLHFLRGKEAKAGDFMSAGEALPGMGCGRDRRSSDRADVCIRRGLSVSVIRGLISKIRGECLFGESAIFASMFRNNIKDSAERYFGDEPNVFGDAEYAFSLQIFQASRATGEDGRRTMSARKIHMLLDGDGKSVIRSGSHFAPI